MVYSISVFLFRKDNNVTVFILFLFLLKKGNEEMGEKRIQLERNIYNIMYNRIWSGMSSLHIHFVPSLLYGKYAANIRTYFEIHSPLLQWFKLKILFLNKSKVPWGVVNQRPCFFPPELISLPILTQWSCSASGSLWEMPDLNPGPVPQKSGALLMSRHLLLLPTTATDDRRRSSHADSKVHTF